jgi:hypothetical protein
MEVPPQHVTTKNNNLIVKRITQLPKLNRHTTLAPRLS